jgi:hypothetical protein
MTARNGARRELLGAQRLDRVTAVTAVGRRPELLTVGVGEALGGHFGGDPTPTARAMVCGEYA